MRKLLARFGGEFFKRNRNAFRVIAEKPVDRVAQFLTLESKRTRPALVDDAAIPINQVQAIGPSRVGLFGRISKLIQNSRNSYPQFAYARASQGSTFFFVSWTGENHLVTNVALHLPNVTGMRLEYVNHEKSHLAAVLIVELIKSGNLPPEGRSSIAAEN